MWRMIFQCFCDGPGRHFHCRPTFVGELCQENIGSPVHAVPIVHHLCAALLLVHMSNVECLHIVEVGRQLVACTTQTETRDHPLMKKCDELFPDPAG